MARAAARRKPAGTERLPQAARAYEELKRRILADEMPAGFQALEQELAEALGMSRTPVREALIRLAEDGMVEVRPRHGMRVLPVSPDDMREIYEVLTGLEATATELAARRGVPADGLAALRAAVADMDRALAADDLDAWAEADARFHRLLVEHAGNARLRAMVATVWDQAHRARMATLRLRPRPAASNAEHAAVLDAIARGDARAAGRLHRAHRERAGRMLLALLERHRIRQL